MAQFRFLKGNYSGLNSVAITEGQLLITKDTRELFVDVDASTRIKIGDFITVATLAELEALDATKVPTSRLYYVEDGNILARSNGTTWIQVNKQPTTEELKVLLGLGTMAYKSEVAESDLTAELAEKVNAAAEGNHSHANKTVLDGITAEKVTAWDAAEGNAKTYADGLNTAMNTRVEALEAIDHEHANKALLDTYTQTEANLADAVAKKHSHTFNETELNKIVEGDVAKWNGVAADHLTSADKTTLENAIKEAKKAGTDANTNIETYKVTNDARVLAVEEDVAEIIDGTNGILAQAKSYSDGKLATARTEISAEIDADVKVVADDLAGYKTSNDAALAGVKATAEAAATKTYTDEELAKKVDKVEGKSLVSDTEITKLAGVSEGANKVEKSETNGNIKVDGAEVVVYTHPDKHTVSEISDFDEKVKAYDYATKTEAQGYADAKDSAIAAAKKAGDDAQKTIDDYKTANDKALADEVKARGEADTALEERIAALEGNFGEGEGTVESKIEAAVSAEASAREEAVNGVQDAVDALDEKVGEIPEGATATTVVGYVDEKVAAINSDAEALAGRVKAIEDDYLVEADKTELSTAIGAEKTRAEGIEAGLRTDINTVMGDYLKAADKTELEGKITAEETRAKGVEESLQNQINTIMNNPDTEGVINSINEFTQYIADHGEIAEGFRTDIDANAKAISDHEALAAQTYETKADATTKRDELIAYVDEKAVQADWSVNDETSPAYVKNRPFYENSNTALVFEGDLDITDNSSSPDYRTDYDQQLLIPIVSDGVYEVVYDGTVYKNVTVKEDYGYRMLGSGQDLGFLVMHRYDEYNATCFAVTTPGVHTFKITQIVESEFVQLDEKFIPDTIARVSDVNTRLDALEAQLGDGEGTVSDLIAQAKQEAIDAATATASEDAANKAAVVLAEAQAYADSQIAIANESITTLEENVYTKSEVEAMIQASTEWGSF